MVPGQVRQHGFEVEELLESIDRDVLPEAKKLANDLYKVQSVSKESHLARKQRGYRQRKCGYPEDRCPDEELGCDQKGGFAFVSLLTPSSLSPLPYLQEHRALEDLTNKALEKNRTISPRNPGPSSSSTGRRSRASSSSSPSPATADAAGGGNLAPSDANSNSISDSTGAASQLPPLAPQPSPETAGGVRTVRASSGRTSFRPSRGGAEGGLAVSLQVQKDMGYKQSRRLH